MFSFIKLYYELVVVSAYVSATLCLGCIICMYGTSEAQRGTIIILDSAYDKAGSAY